jgi:hypothetical protein
MAAWCVFRNHPTEEVWVRCAPKNESDDPVNYPVAFEAETAEGAVRMAFDGTNSKRYFAVLEKELKFFDVGKEVERIETLIVEPADYKPRRWFSKG